MKEWKVKAINSTVGTYTLKTLCFRGYIETADTKNGKAI